MVRRRIDKKIKCLEPHFKDVLVCRDKKERPYIEIFVQAPENINQQNLGTLAGILEITDSSEDSSYIVNYIISVIKKEYYAQAKRGPIESFEAAFHKANLALSKLAEHGNVNWIGHLNAVCLACEKNNIHLCQTGTSQAYLLRSKSLTNICEKEESLADPNPLKTFEDVISGRLEENDKVVLTTETIFNILSPEEIKRNAINFSEEKFIQFLKTAMINELDRAAVLVIDAKEKKEPEPETSSQRNAKVNAFSQTTFISKPKTRLEIIQENQLIASNKKGIAEELKKELEKSGEGIINRKSGHIYIKESPASTMEETSSSVSTLRKVPEKMVRLQSKLKNSLKVNPEYISRLSSRIRSISFRKPISSSPIEIQSKPPTEINLTDSTINKKPRKMTVDFSGYREKSAVIFFWLQKNLRIFWEKSKILSTDFIFFLKAFITNRIVSPTKKISSYVTSTIKEKLAKEKNKPFSDTNFSERKETEIDYAQNPELSLATRNQKKEWLNILSNRVTSSGETSDLSGKRSRRLNLLPNLDRIKSVFSRLDYLKKVYLLIVLLLLFVVPYFIVKIQDKLESKEKIATPVVIPVLPEPLTDDKNIIRIGNTASIYSGENLSRIINLSGQILAIGETKIIDLSNKKSFNILEEFQNPDLVSAMEDLNLLFLIKNGKILSVSPSTAKAQVNNIAISSPEKIQSAGTYLTYLYLLDSENNQIYRYPRAEGGFGEKTNWIKDSSVTLSPTKDMAISENIFIIDGEKITKLFRGKKQEFILEDTATKIIPEKLYIKEDGENLYILDNTNSRIIKLDMEGHILSQFHHSDLKTARNFAVDEEKKIIYFASEKEVKSFEMK